MQGLGQSKLGHWALYDYSKRVFYPLTKETAKYDYLFQTNSLYISTPLPDYKLFAPSVLARWTE